jgi:hypothetical protein
MRRAIPLLVCLLVACDDGESSSPAAPPALNQRPSTPDPTHAPPVQEDTRQIVPGPGMPPEYVAKNSNPGETRSNNNVEVIRHAGKVFLAIRNGKFHYASTDSRLYVFSSTDEVTWSLEKVFDEMTDLREPRLLSYKGRLFLYFAKLGADRYNFEPHGMFVSEYTGPAQWTDPQPFYEPGKSFIPWRVKVINDRAYMTTYAHGEHEYDFTGLPMDVHFLTTDDGLSWHGVDPAHPIVTSGGGSETDFTLDDRGDLYAVIRNESGDSTGWGAKICYAPAQALARWDCTHHDSRKYDSPLVFNYKGEVFLIGRRNVTDTGNFELDPGDPWSGAEAVKNLATYSGKPKRTALWQVDRSTLDVRFIVDLPGKGDTCFPSMLLDPAEPRRRIV